MVGLPDLLRNHIDYTIWATGRLLEASAELKDEQRQHDFGTADKSVQGTLTHLMRSERLWFRRLQEGIAARPANLPGDEEWNGLASEWRRVHEEWRNWGKSLSLADVEADSEYNDLKGNRWVQPSWQIVLHVVNHSTHHRGQVSGFLRVLGKTPPPLDFIAFVRTLKN